MEACHRSTRTGLMPTSSTHSHLPRQEPYRKKENSHSKSPHHPLDEALSDNTIFELEHRMSNRIRDEVGLRQNPRVEYPNEIRENRQGFDGSRLVNPVRNSSNNRTENQRENK